MLGTLHEIPEDHNLNTDQPKNLKAETVTLVVHQSVDGSWTQGKQIKTFFNEPKDTLWLHFLQANPKSSLCLTCGLSLNSRGRLLPENDATRSQFCVNPRRGAWLPFD